MFQCSKRHWSHHPIRHITNISIARIHCDRRRINRRDSWHHTPIRRQSHSLDFRTRQRHIRRYEQRHMPRNRRLYKLHEFRRYFSLSRSHKSSDFTKQRWRLYRGNSTTKKQQCPLAAHKAGFHILRSMPRRSRQPSVKFHPKINTERRLRHIRFNHCRWIAVFR